MSQDRETWSSKDRAEQEEIDKKQQDLPDVGEIPENEQIKPIVWGGGGVYQRVKKSALPLVYIGC